jgi:hypothetical protein
MDPIIPPLKAKYDGVSAMLSGGRYPFPFGI